MTAVPPRPRTIVIVSFSYWPVANARAFRWTALAEDWTRRGLDVHVVCGLHPARPDEEAVNGVQVHRVGVPAIERVRARLAARRARSFVPGGTAPPARGAGAREWVFRALSFANRHVWRNVYWPDTTCLWYAPARRKAAALVGARRADALISVSPTYTAVAVGYRVRRRSRARLRWLVDLGDPFSFLEEAPPNNLRLYRRLNRRFERACFAAADAVSVTNPATRSRYASLFPESARKLVVIPPLVSLPELPPPAADAGARTRLVFLGTLYRTIRRPDFLLALFAALAARQPGPELHFFGDVRECESSFAPYAALAGGALHLHGVVSRERALQAMADASVLVNLGNQTAYQLPSKVVEYALTGKPILNIAVRADDSSASFLASYPRQLTLFARPAGPTEEDVARARSFLAAAAPVDPVALAAWLAPYRLPAVAAQYLAALEPTE
jgi:glycosyltransferase involved in cell wall biosynthesis